MAHGTPLGIADNDERYGAQGAFLIEAGISSSYHIANFFGLTQRIHQPKAAAKTSTKTASETPKQAAKSVPVIPPVVMAELSTMPDLSKVLWPLTTLNPRPEPAREPKRRAIDVGAVITRALTAAGLMK
jgi:hypothetical protein